MVRATLALYGEDVTYVTLEFTNKEYDGIEKLLNELHDKNGIPYERNVDIKVISYERH